MPIRGYPNADGLLCAEARRHANACCFAQRKESSMFKLAMTVACAVVAIAAVPALAAAQAPAFGGDAFSEDDPTITNCSADEFGGTNAHQASGAATRDHGG